MATVMIMATFTRLLVNHMNNKEELHTNLLLACFPSLPSLHALSLFLPPSLPPSPHPVSISHTHCMCICMYMVSDIVSCWPELTKQTKLADQQALQSPPSLKCGYKHRLPCSAPFMGSEEGSVKLWSTCLQEKHFTDQVMTLPLPPLLFVSRR